RRRACAVRGGCDVRRRRRGRRAAPARGARHVPPGARLPARRGGRARGREPLALGARGRGGPRGPGSPLPPPAAPPPGAARPGGGGEPLPPAEPDTFLPVHAYLLAEAGAPVVENLWLEELAAAGIAEVAFLAFPLKLRGSTGCPVRPVALPLRAG